MSKYSESEGVTTMANIERNKPYILSEIIKETGIPVSIRKETWSPDFVFRVDRVANGTAYGTAFKNGVEHKRKYGAYTYSLNEQFCVVEIAKSRKDIGSWEELNAVGTFAKYTINENYRNTMQITEFVNDELFMSMVGMGLEGVDVDLQPSSQIAKERQIASLGDRKAIIYKDEEALAALSEDLSGYDVYTVREAKGMEFETVLVIPNGMTDNELYVAYTRALNRLFLLDV